MQLSSHLLDHKSSSLLAARRQAVCYRVQVKPLRDIRRENLHHLTFEAGGQKALADKLGKDKNQVYQWGLPADNPASRNISDRTARAIEESLGKPRGWMDHEHLDPATARSAPAASSQSGGLDSGKLSASITFLEQQFALWDREFNAADQTLLIAGVYQRLTASDTPNLIELSRWLTDQMTGGSNEREGEVGSIGGADRGRNPRRAGAA